MICFHGFFLPSFSVHCEWSNWGQWSKCTKSCGGGSQEEGGLAGGAGGGSQGMKKSVPNIVADTVVSYTVKIKKYYIIHFFRRRTEATTAMDVCLDEEFPG